MLEFSGGGARRDGLQGVTVYICVLWHMFGGKWIVFSGLPLFYRMVTLMPRMGESFGGVLVVGLKGAGYDLCFMLERTVFSRLQLFYWQLWRMYLALGRSCDTRERGLGGGEHTARIYLSFLMYVFGWTVFGGVGGQYIRLN